MPHICVRCGREYPDGAKELLEGCPCGSHFFYYVREGNLEKWRKQVPRMTKEEAKQVERDIKSIIGLKETEEVPIILDIETIRVEKPGKYLIDLTKLFSGERPVIYKIRDGKYYIDLSSL
ncbi:hypothetical protein DRN62_02980 [Nanoarchaeota archaeon]|nr:MAG: hypothetical protein DRN62_02980 [Nanoarchaeota archaeon]